MYLLFDNRFLSNSIQINTISPRNLDEFRGNCAFFSIINIKSTRRLEKRAAKGYITGKDDLKTAGLAGSAETDNAVFRRWLESASLMDDEYMTCFFRDSPECVAFLIGAVLGDPGIGVRSIRVQEPRSGAGGRGVVFEVLARRAAELKRKMKGGRGMDPILKGIVDKYVQEGMEKGMRKGRKSVQSESAARMLSDGMPAASVAKYLGMTASDVEKVAKSI